MKTITYRCPAALTALGRLAGVRGQLLPYQAAALYELAMRYNDDGAQILEIGTAAGYSAAVMAQAAPKAKIVTLNSVIEEIPVGIRNLLPYRNVTVRRATSWKVLEVYRGPLLDMVFVDGDHRKAALDVPWFNWLKGGGLILFHDYTREGSLPVVEAVQQMGLCLLRAPDVLIQDNSGVGMAGFYRRSGERLG